MKLTLGGALARFALPVLFFGGVPAAAAPPPRGRVAGGLWAVVRTWGRTEAALCLRAPHSHMPNY